MRLIAALVLAPSVLLAEVTIRQQTFNTLGTGGTTVEVDVSSSNVVERGWKRNFVMVNPDGEILNDDGKVGSAADTAAINEVASNATSISSAAYDAMTNSLQVLYAATNNMAQYAQSFALSIAPETDRETLTMYVVDESTTGSVDTQWVWINKALGLAPNRWVVYEYWGGAATQKCTWVSWTTNGVSRTVNGQTWTGVHQCTVTRPSWATDVACLTKPNDTFGSNSGMDFGDMTIRLGSDYGYTGYVTNDLVSPKIELYFDSGFLKSRREVQ